MKISHVALVASLLGAFVVAHAQEPTAEATPVAPSPEVTAEAVPAATPAPAKALLAPLYAMPEKPNPLDMPVITDDAAIAELDARIKILETAGRIDKTAEDWRTQMPLYPELTFTPGRTYLWTLDTNKGAITLEFTPSVAPKHVSSFIYLTKMGYFDGLKFHRVIPGFMAQGGCPLGSGMGDPGYEMDGEFSPSVKHDRPYLLSAANSGPGTDGSQFFITFGPTAHLDGRHTIFGEVIDGTDAVEALQEQGTPSGTPKEELVINKATVSVR